MPDASFRASAAKWVWDSSFWLGQADRGKSFFKYNSLINSLCLVSNVLRPDLSGIVHIPLEKAYTGVVVSIRICSAIARFSNKDGLAKALCASR
jgi:hypothetical protein